MSVQELIRVSILWREMWRESLDEALRFYMDQNIPAMYNALQHPFQTLQKVNDIHGDI